jgi:hypothetical protein
VFIEYTRIHAVILCETLYFGSQKISIVVYTAFLLMFKNDVRILNSKITHKIIFITDVAKLGKAFKFMHHSDLCTESVLQRRRTKRSPGPVKF